MAEELLAQLGTPEVAQKVLQHRIILARPSAAMMLLACRKQVRAWCCVLFAVLLL
jgi:hypothetical protein